MTDLFHKHLLTELHMAVYRPGDPDGMTDRLLCEAVTVNENLQSLGYILKPEDLIRLAVSPDLYDFYDHVKALVPEVKAQPMYPGFPRQVLEMDEAEFRFHQMLHYFSTYGLERLFGVSVSRGWLPDLEVPVRDQADTRLLESRVVELVSEEEAAATALRILLGRRERLTNPELELVLEAASACPAEQMLDMKVRFKENLDLLFPRLVEHEDREVALRTLRCICAHTGDVFRCVSALLSRQKFHLVTRQKKLLVKLLEAYPVADFRRNLMQSLRDRERNLTVLKHLDYNRFSRSPQHLEAVRALRNGELLSWHGIAEALLKEQSPEALAHLAQRPGYMVRMLNRLLSMGFDREAILEALEPRAGLVSAHLLLKVLRTLTGRKNDLEEKYNRMMREAEAEYDHRIRQLQPAALKQAYERSLEEARYEREEGRRNLKRVFLDDRLEKAWQEAKSRVRPLELDVLRMESKLRVLQVQLRRLEDCIGTDGSIRMVQNALSSFMPELLEEELDPQRVREELAARTAECAQLREAYEREERKARNWLKKRREVIQQEYPSLVRQETARLERDYDRKVEQLAQEYIRKRREAVGERQELTEQKHRRLEELEELKLQEGKMRQYDAAVVEILKVLLQAHFRQAATPLKDKRVCIQMDQFDLDHSLLELDERSADGGYIRSGIAWKIPEDARYVRFFTYWNDRRRIDIDLHAGGRTLKGEVLHVGWNADFRDCGVVHSGDITHSDAAEYIDIDLSQPIAEIYANVHSFNGRPFRDIETCFVGMMAVDKIGADVKHYDPANCFFTHELKQNLRSLYYGFIDVQNRFVRFVGKENVWRWGERPDIENPVSMFSLQTYLDYVLEGQGVELVEKPEEADFVLTMGKSLLDNGLSLVDSIFFLEC